MHRNTGHSLIPDCPFYRGTLEKSLPSAACATPRCTTQRSASGSLHPVPKTPGKVFNGAGERGQRENPERHEYELYLAVEDIDHSRTKTKSPQTNGICERFHKTILNEFYRVAFRKKVYRSIDELQADLDVWIREYNQARPHQGRWCFGKTPMQTFVDASPIAKEKVIAA
jgi:hypothetical protein